MSVPMSRLQLPHDFRERFGRKDAWHGDTHTQDGKLIEAARGKPRLAQCLWYPAALVPSDPVDELHMIYDDGQVVKVPAENFAVLP